MFIKTLYAENFRNYLFLDLELNNKINIFIGENGEGKTNILEAIYLFSHLKSFRDNSDDEMTNWNKTYYYLKIKLNSEPTEVYEIGYTKEKEKKKKLKINGSEVPKKTDFIGKVKNITFLPNDLKILESPQERRKFIDAFLCSVDYSYLENLLTYNKILKHRNKLLKEQNFSYQEADVWDKMLAEKGVYLQTTREKFFHNFMDFFKKNTVQISHSRDNIEIKYLPNVEDKNLFLAKLKNKREIDLKLGYTTVGIHRDDFFIGIKNKEINSFGSQGQKRTVVLALKASLFDYSYELLSIKPILLVDDIIRELDILRRNDFLNFLKSANQVFFTTTDLDGLLDYINQIKEHIQIFQVKGGKVEKFV